VPEGAMAWDKEDGDVSKRTLCCPRTACMQFNCPRGQLNWPQTASQGPRCGIDTANVPVGNVFVLAFTVLDFSFPPVTSEAVRRIIVVSPCDKGQTYCPDLAKPAHPIGEFACGTADCISRAAIVALQLIQPRMGPPSIALSNSLPVSAISNTSAGFWRYYRSVLGRSATTSSQVCSLLHHYLCSLCIAFPSRIISL
jgi:hypothetical protein